MRRIAGISALVGILSGLPLIGASAGDGTCHTRRAGCSYYAAPVGPFEAWRAYYNAQAELSFARRAARGNYYVARGRALPSAYFGPPTNYYAERYSLDPYSYFNCPLARQGAGICPGLPPLSAVP